MAEKTLNHFAFFRFTQYFWALEGTVRERFLTDWQTSLGGTAECTHYYQVSPLRADVDVLVWNALTTEKDEDGGRFFQNFARQINARRRWMELSSALWGFTKPSQYARGASSQEIEPLVPERKPYLVVYPFVKTAEWYLLSRDTRQGMMNQHIRIGHQYPEIKQLLLYSFGLQDQEFVVVYEMDSLTQFSDLVNELRSSEARRYTERDTPNYSAVWRTPQEIIHLYAAEQGVGEA